MKKLPKSYSEMGYSSAEIIKILKKLKIKPKLFWKTFGVNTVSCTKKMYPRYYRCDIERALYLIGNKLGKDHSWD